MSQWLKQSTAIYIQLGPFLDEADGKTAETGLTISQADVKLSKGGAAFAQKNDANAAVHDAGGWYRCQLNATDTGTSGRLIVAVHESGALPVWREFLVVPANEYDSLISGSDALQVDAVEISSSSAAADNVEANIGNLDAAISGLNDPTAGAIADAVWDEASAGHTDAGKAGQQLWTDVDAILADTNELQADDVPGLIAALNDPTAAAIRTEIDNNSTQLAAIVADTNELQTDDVPGLIAALNDPTAAAIADAVWDEASTGHVDAGKAGQQLWTDVDAILTDTNELQTDDMPGLIAALNDPTAAAIRTEIDNNSMQLAAILADTGTDGVAIATATAQAIADEILKRGISNVEDAADATSLAALVLAAFESAISGSTWTIRKTGGTTFATKTVTTDADADPIIGVT